MLRRNFIRAIGYTTVAWPWIVMAQPATKVWRIGYLASGPLDGGLVTFKQQMADQGYVEGKSFVIDAREALGRFDLLPGFAKEIVSGSPDVIVAEATPAIAAVQHETSSIPIVMSPSTDPIGSGFVKSFAHPGGNITGVANMFGDLTAKSLEILHLVVPNAKTVAVLMSSNPTHAALFEVARKGAERIGLTALPYVAPTPADLERVFLEIKKSNCEALYVLADPYRPIIAELAASAQLPSIYQYSLFVDLGGLMSYGPDVFNLFRRAAVYVDKIVKGAKPADLPVEQPTKFDFVLNMKSAKALGLSIPESVVVLADKVIE
ncbi:ABC transporter substrate-binding protein [Bradyrhizobium sp. LLZ17]|uniref:ABC transporter substrate-binding protein n=1 Tax=Bradyrhizobium sp. LLZ17 TaxID=3239388 RepID=A0AB39XFB6_9BRAD